MKLSIITVCLNSEITIDETIMSVLSQGEFAIEYIVVDGGSTDSTMSILGVYKEHIGQVISAPGSSIYDAMNIGLENCTGEIVTFLNSDDVLVRPGVLKMVLNQFERSSIDFLYGDVQYLNSESQLVRYWRAGPIYPWSLFLGWMAPHPGFFFRRSSACIDLRFDTGLKISSDYDFLIRLIIATQCNGYYLNDLIVSMRSGGISNSGFRNSVLRISEDWNVAGRYFRFPSGVVFCKIARKVFQIRKLRYFFH